MPVYRSDVSRSNIPKVKSLKQDSDYQSREWVDGSRVMGQMGHENRMVHMGNGSLGGSLGVDP